MSGNELTLVATDVSVAVAAEIAEKILDEGNLPVIEESNGLYTVSARSYSGGFRPYTRWPIRIIDHNIRFRVTKPYRRPEVVPFVYPRDRKEYEEYIGNKAFNTFQRLADEADERRQEHEDAYERTMEHIQEKLGDNAFRKGAAAPENVVRHTIDSILRQGFFIDPDADKDE